MMRRRRSHLLTTLRPRVAAGGGGSADPYAANVVSLLHGNGANGSTAIVDETGLVWSYSGTQPVLSSAQKQFGATSINMASDSVLTASPGVAVGTGKFTLESFFYGGTDKAFMQIGNLLVYSPGSSGNLYVWNGSTNIISVTSVITANAFNYVALRKTDAGNLELYGPLGTLVGQVAFSDNLGTPDLKLGWYNGDNTAPLYIDEFRATFGVAREISVPTEEFPNP